MSEQEPEVLGQPRIDLPDTSPAGIRHRAEKQALRERAETAERRQREAEDIQLRRGAEICDLHGKLDAAEQRVQDTGRFCEQLRAQVTALERERDDWRRTDALRAAEWARCERERNQLREIVSILGAPSPPDNEAKLARFLERLRASQVDLPADAARVLRENLWALYDDGPAAE